MRESEYARSQKEIEKSLQVEGSGWLNPFWGVNDSPLESRLPFTNSYDKTFRSTLPENISLRSDIESILAVKKGKAVGLELGGTGSSLFAGFSDNFFQRSVSINLADRRNVLTRHRDNRHHHTVLVGDIQQDYTKQQVASVLGGEKADLIIERMMRGVTYLPQDIDHLGKEANYWYQQLSVGGLMYLQAPDALSPIIESWAKKVSEEYDSLQVNVSWYEQVPWASVRIYKKEKAPDELPLLSQKEVRRSIQRQYSKQPMSEIIAVFNPPNKAKNVHWVT